LTRKHATLAFFLVLAFCFWVVNRGAYQGYFQDDDLDNLVFTQQISAADFFTPLLWPRVFDNNFRPVGHLLYRMMAKTAGLRFTPYIALIQILHLVNVILLWLILRKLQIPPIAAAAALIFWAFHMASFDVFWKFMYIFDLFCGLFCLLSLLAYMNGRVLWSLLAMWLGYRSKEVAIMLPLVLAAYEWLLGERRAKRLLPFFALSLLLGAQALFENQHRGESAYTLHLNAQSLWTCLRFYASQVFLIPYAGFTVLLLPLVFRDRRVLFGVISFCALLVPMLLLPGRLFSPYLYVPLLGLSFAVAAVAVKPPAPVTAICLLLWLPWMLVNLRRDRRITLADSRDRRTYIHTLQDYARANPDILNFVAAPGPYNSYGTEGAIRLTHPVGAKIRFALADAPGWKDVMTSSGAAILNWDPSHHELGILTRRAGDPDASYLKMGSQTPIWQLEQGWYENEGLFRWIAPEASARLRRPDDARHFELIVNAGPELLSKIRRSTVSITLNGIAIGAQTFDQPGIRKVRWELQPAPSGPVEVGFHVAPEYRSPRPLGIAVVSFGFVK